MTKIPIRDYRDFWDLPRIFLVERNDVILLFDCKFDEDKEDYDNTYSVYVMPDLAGRELAGSWNQLTNKALKLLGTLSVEEVVFDASRRKWIDDDVIAQRFFKQEA